MERIQPTFSLHLDPYLSQWFIARCGGETPVRLPRRSLYSTIVQQLSRRKGESASPDIAGEGDIEVYIPDNKAKPCEEYCVVTPRVKEMIADTLRSEFDLCLFNDLVRHLFPTDLKENLIFEWMEANGIECTERNWQAVEKRYSRLRAKLLTRKRVRKYREKTSE